MEKYSGVKQLYPGVIGLLVVGLQRRFRAWVEDCVSSGLLMGEIFIDIGTFKA